MFAFAHKKPKVSQILEASSIAVVRAKEKSLTGRKLVIYDFDNVLAWLGSEVIVGTDPWFDKHLKSKHAELGDLTAAELATLAIFIEVHESTPVLPVEAETAEYINELQAEGTCAIAITARSGKYLAKLTRRQANDLKFCFSNSQRFKAKSVNLAHIGPHCQVEDGYFYTGGLHKGTVLIAGLAGLGITITDYDWVIYIDDDLKRVNQVKESVEGHTNFIGFRYNVLDAHLERLRRLIAENFSKAKL
jgi:hypothetical protein